MGGPSEANSSDSLFGEKIIEDQEPELSASFYVERNPADQAAPQPFQPFSLEGYQTPSPLELPANPVELLRPGPNGSELPKMSPE